MKTSIFAAFALFAGTVLFCHADSVATDENAVPEEPAVQIEESAPQLDEAMSITIVKETDDDATENVVTTTDETVITETKINSVKTVESHVSKSSYDPRYKMAKVLRSVIMTTNYSEPRALCELAGKRENVPYILLPPESAEVDPELPVVFVSAKGEKLAEFKVRDLSVFIAYLRPKNIVILGNADYVPAFYETAVPESVNKIKIDDVSWKYNALRLANELNNIKIYDDYRASRPKSGAY